MGELSKATLLAATQGSCWNGSVDWFAGRYSRRTNSTHCKLTSVQKKGRGAGSESLLLQVTGHGNIAGHTDRHAHQDDGHRHSRRGYQADDAYRVFNNLLKINYQTFA